MAKISHFVVTYNHETKEWNIDEEDVQRLGGAVFDTVSEKWQYPSMKTEEGKIDWLASNVIFDAVRELEELNG